MTPQCRFSTLTTLLGSALITTHALAQPQVAPSALADCAEIAGDSDRLACFDRIGGRAARPSTEPKHDAVVAPAPSNPGSVPSQAVTTTHAARAPGGSGSMYDKAWAFDASSPPYDIWRSFG